MSKLNTIVLTSDLELRVFVKNKFENTDVIISGYADPDENGKIKIQGMKPDIILCLTHDEPSDEYFAFVHDLLCKNHGCFAALMCDNVSVSTVNKAAEVGIRTVVGMNDDAKAIEKDFHRIFTLEAERQTDSNGIKKIRSKVIAFGGAKGGAGRTTVATNVAAALAQAGKRVILIDLDLQFGDVAMMLNLEPKDTIVDLVRDRGDLTIENINNYSLIHYSGMSVLCAPLSAEYAEYVTPKNVEEIINICRLYFEYIIIDLPASLNDIAISSFDSCNAIMLVYNLDMLSIKNAKSYVTVLEQLQHKDKIKLILNKCYKGIVRPSDFEKTVGYSPFGSITLDFKSAQLAANNGETFFGSLSNTQPAKDINQIVKNILDLYHDITILGDESDKNEADTKKKHKGLFGRK